MAQTSQEELNAKLARFTRKKVNREGTPTRARHYSSIPPPPPPPPPVEKPSEEAKEAKQPPQPKTDLKPSQGSETTKTQNQASDVSVLDVPNVWVQSLKKRELALLSVIVEKGGGSCFVGISLGDFKKSLPDRKHFSWLSNTLKDLETIGFIKRIPGNGSQKTQWKLIYSF
jgi:hypothetical protein